MMFNFEPWKEISDPLYPTQTQFDICELAQSNMVKSKDYKYPMQNLAKILQRKITLIN